MNILTPTRKGDAYDLVAINKFPLIYRTDRTPDDFLKDKCVIDNIESLIRNDTVRNKSVLYIRTINEEDMSWVDKQILVKELLENA
jgi:hypothetical protein